MDWTRRKQRSKILLILDLIIFVLIGKKQNLSLVVKQPLLRHASVFCTNASYIESQVRHTKFDPSPFITYT